MRIGKQNRPGEYNPVDTYEDIDTAEEPKPEFNRTRRPVTHRGIGTSRHINRGIHGIVKSVEENRVTVRVISSDLFEINDIIRLDCTPYTKITRTLENNEAKEIDLNDLRVGDRVKAKYLNVNIDRLASIIEQVLSIEVY